MGLAKTVSKVFDHKVEVMLDRRAGSNHVTEELVAGMLNRAADLGITPEDRRFPVIRFEQWAYPEYVHGIAAGAPVPLKGAVVLRVTLLEGVNPDTAKDGPEIFVRCKVAARGTSDWHGLILGGRALDHTSRLGLGFRPGPDCHIFDTLGVKTPRCEDLSRTRKDRAYPFTSMLSSVDDRRCAEPGDSSRQLLLYMMVKRPSRLRLEKEHDGSLCEGVFPIDTGVEAVPGVWPSAEMAGLVLLTSGNLDAVLQPGEPVGKTEQA